MRGLSDQFSIPLQRLAEERFQLAGALPGAATKTKFRGEEISTAPLSRAADNQAAARKWTGNFIRQEWRRIWRGNKPQVLTTRRPELTPQRLKPKRVSPPRDWR
jgi:hypothetical protein